MRSRLSLFRGTISCISMGTILLAVLFGSAMALEGIGKTSGGLSVKIEGTRQRLAVGTGFGVTATVTNNTNSTVYVNEDCLRLKVPAEIEGRLSGRISYYPAYLPAAKRGKEGTEAYNNATLELKPNQSTSAFWLMNPRELWGSSGSSAPSGPTISLLETLGHLNEQVLIELNYLFFEPGSYRLTITADYWHDANLAGNPDLVTESENVDVAAPQSVILIGAALGGLAAFVILPQARRRLSETTGLLWYPMAVWGVFGAMLLSAIVTILLARISETQFLIRVTVSDFWGAIAVGFIANYLGVEALNKIMKPPEKSDGEPKQQPSEGKKQVDLSKREKPQTIELVEKDNKLHQPNEPEKT